MFSKLRFEKNLSYYEEEDVDENEDTWRAQIVIDEMYGKYEKAYKTDYCNGNIEIVKNIYQKCVICFKNPSVCAFCQCGYQCMCDNCWTISKVELLNALFMELSFS